MSLILDLIFPKYCYGCKKLGNYLCSRCSEKIGIQSVKTDPTHQFEGIVSVFKYNSFIKRLIYDLKYNFVSDVCNETAEICVQKIKVNYPHLLQYWQDENFYLTPVPLHPFRQNWRGFNQSSLLGQKIAKSLKLNYLENILIRKINTVSQVKLKHKRQRFSNISSAFAINPSQKIPQNIILFDDVITTGSTLDSAIKTLKISPAFHCWCLTLAG